MKKLIVMVLGKRVFTFLIIAFIIIAGILAYQNLKIDVFPDPSPVLVQLHVDAEGMAPEEAEKFVSYPIETSLYGLPHIKKVTSFSGRSPNISMSRMILAINTANDIPATSRNVFSLFKYLSANFGSIWSWNILVFFFQTITTKYIQTTIRTPAINQGITIGAATQMQRLFRLITFSPIITPLFNTSCI